MIFKVLKSNKRLINKLAKKHGVEIDWTLERNGLDIGSVVAYEGFSELGKFVEETEAALLPNPDMFLHLIELRDEVERARNQFLEKYGTVIDGLKP